MILIETQSKKGKLINRDQFSYEMELKPFRIFYIFQYSNIMRYYFLQIKKPFRVNSY